ncbi:MAG TPA: lipase, partial [Actinomycetes bacterium]|nr:lipase [Actinomycetes bacterium]
MSPRRRALIVVTALAVVLGLAAAVAAGAGLWRRAEPELARAAEVPVLLVPGYNGTPGSLAVLAARLRAAGRDVEVVSLPDRGTRDLRASAETLAAAVDRTGA